MIELDDESYILGFWFSANPNTLDDWLCCVIKDPNNPEQYKGFSRFRYSQDNDNNVFDSDDEKSWMSFICKENQSEEEIIRSMRNIQKEVKEGYPIKDEIIVKGDIEKFMKLCDGKSWMHMKCVKNTNSL